MSSSFIFGLEQYAKIPWNVITNSNRVFLSVSGELRTDQGPPRSYVYL